MKLTTQHLTTCRKFANQALPDEAIVERVTAQPDGYGSQTLTWSVVGTYPARLGAGEPGDEELREASNRVEAHKKFTVTLPATAEVSATDRVTINNSQQFEIIEPIIDTSWLITRQFRVKVWQQL